MFTITLNTIRELVRNKFFSLILFLGVVFLGMSYALETLALGQLERVLYDFGLSFIELTGVAVILFLGGGMIAREIEGRTIFLMLSKPVSRSSIFIGKFLGFSLVVMSMVIFQSLLLIGLLFFKGFGIDSLMLPAIFGIILKLFSLLVLILFFSTFVSPMIAMFLTIASYIIGHGGYAMLDYSRWEASTQAYYIGRALLIFFPNLEAMNLKNYVATGAPINLGVWYSGYSVGIIYILTILCIGAWIFSRKSFDNA
ncbi:MAG: ABC transporter permease subunit [Candidatus Altimarinota bacterium]